MIPMRLRTTLAVLLILTACGGAPQTNKRAEPLWVESPGAVYSGDLYLTAVGYGADRASAEQRALAALAGRFGQSVQGELEILNAYSEAVRNGRVDVSEYNALRDTVKISTSMDLLIGADIADHWFDNRSTHYALALMEKASAASVYTEMIRSNEQIIDRLVNLPDSNSLEAYSRYRLAAIIADVNQVFYNVLSVAGGTGVSRPRQGEHYRIEAVAIAAAIPIAIQVSNDRDGRIRAAFAESLSRAGFRSTANGGARYTLNAVVYLAPSDAPNAGGFQFVYYTVESGLMDQRMEVFPFNISGKGDGLNLNQAENAALKYAANEINESYGEALLASLGGK